MATFVHRYTQDLRRPLRAVFSGGLTFTGDIRGHRLEVEVLDGGSAAALAGTVSGTAIRADGQTVAFAGSFSGNVASVTLPKSAYAVPGPLAVFVTITTESGSTATTLLKAVYSNDLSSTDTIVDPGTIIPSVNALLAAIESAVDSIPADYSALLASVAPEFSTSTAYAVGDYVWHSGVLYRFVKAKSAGSWASSYAVAANLADSMPNAKVGTIINGRDVLFYLDWENSEITINGSPRLLYGGIDVEIASGTYSYASTSTTGRKYFVYDRADGTMKIIDDSAYEPQMIVAVAFQRSLDYLLNNPRAVYPPCRYQVGEILCPQEKSLGFDYLADVTGLTRVTLPEAFGHTSPIAVYEASNARYFADVDPEDYKIASAKAGYVGPGGNDQSNGATMLTPKATIQGAVTSSNNFDTVYVLPGVYYWGEQAVSRPVNIIALGEVKIIRGSDGKIAPSGVVMRLKAPCYVEGFEFIGGSGVVVDYSGSDPTCFKHCVFRNSSGNGLNARCQSMLVFECEASDNGIDGFNYHQHSETVANETVVTAPTGIVEIGSKAARNGNVGDRSGNASTIHDNGCIIRVGGEYSMSHGGIMTDSEAQSVNFNCRAFGSLENNAADPEWTNTAFLAGTYTTMWLYGCMGGGADYILGARDSSHVYVDRAIRASRCYVDETSQISVME